MVDRWIVTSIASSPAYALFKEAYAGLFSLSRSEWRCGLSQLVYGAKLNTLTFHEKARRRGAGGLDAQSGLKQNLTEAQS
jgi:hypothetical protein